MHSHRPAHSRKLDARPCPARTWIDMVVRLKQRLCSPWSSVVILHFLMVCTLGAPPLTAEEPYIIAVQRRPLIILLPGSHRHKDGPAVLPS